MGSAVPTPAVPKVRAEVHLGGNTRQLGHIGAREIHRHQAKAFYFELYQAAGSAGGPFVRVMVTRCVYSYWDQGVPSLTLRPTLAGIGPLVQV
jgi:hypothetical protein